MNEFPKQEVVLGLVQEAMTRLGQLGGHLETTLKPGFVQTRQSFETSVGGMSQWPLILTAASLRIRNMEKKIVAVIVGDDSITSQQMSHLVRLRVICAELLNKLAEIQEGIKRTLRGPRRAGAPLR
jgi:hypothetical protein